MRGYDPSDGACDGDATLIECDSCGDVYDGAEYESCPVCYQGPGVPPPPEEPDRIPTRPEGFVTNAELVYGDVLPWNDGEILEGAGQ